MQGLTLVVLAVVAVVVVLPSASSEKIAYSCGTKSTHYTTKCGWFGWQRCSRYRSTTRTCYKMRPVNGGWSAYGSWSAYSTCTKTCGGGTMSRFRTRSCTEPLPAYGGASCSGRERDTQTARCNTHKCPVDGGWSDYTAWTEYSTCTTTCGGGSQFKTRDRSCTNPAPAHGGRDCDGDTRDRSERDCNTHPCPIDGGWTDWEEWQDMDDCSVLCGGGKKDQNRSRSCTNPSPAFGGADCDGESYQNRTIVCNTEECGDLCPKDEVTFHAHTTNEKRFYQCSNGVAHRHQCPEGTVYDSVTSVCNHAPKTACPDIGVAFLAHESDCTKFYMCSNGIKHDMACPATTMFDATLKVCTHGTC
ncbi:coadhesin-like [Haliotis asinina]|uniref:coadhesin-like n=1 Tax=Haliotis asinina TaxID=109174 RepID=UPI003531C91E